MNNNTLTPLMQCLDVNLRDASTVDVTALHETGHLIVMYALDMMHYFKSITITAGTHTNEVTGAPDAVEAITDVTSELAEQMQRYATDLQSAGIPQSGLKITELMRKTKLQGAALYLPQICRLFGGGSICRYYGLPDEGKCRIDNDFIVTLLTGLGMPGTIDTVRGLVDKYLESIFVSFELLTKAIYKNLKQQGTLDKEQVMQIIAEWEQFSW